jgi:hypothetical protein
MVHIEQTLENTPYWNALWAMPFYLHYSSSVFGRGKTRMKDYL